MAAEGVLQWKEREPLVLYKSNQGSSMDDVLQQVGTAGDDLVARLALPDAGDGTLHAVLAAEGAVVLGVLRDFDLLHDLTERRTVTRAVLATDTNFLSALALEN